MRNLLALIASVGLIGCVGDMPGGGGGGPDDDEPGAGNTPGNNPAGADLAAAKQLYDDNVHTIMAAKCSGGACHAEDAQGSTLTRFVAKDPANGWKMATGYVTFVGNFTTSAPVLTKLAAPHQGQTYTDGEKAKISEWLAKEVELRNGQTNTPQQGGETLSQAADRVMAQFAGCMKLTDFQQTNMAGAWANLQSGEGACKRCHASGGEGFIANESAPTGFGVVSAKKMFWLQYFTVDLTQGAAGAQVKPNTVSFAGVCNRLPPHQAHPTFQCANNAGQQALKAFYDRTIANITAGGCAPKQLENN